MNIQAGSNLTIAGDQLKKINIEYLFHSIRQPKQEILNRINQLRIVRSINPKQYGQLKKQLPYFVCGIFNPSVRRTENFAYTSYFVLDLDHISEKGIPIEELRNKIEKDNRVVLSFISPGEDGLKIIFRLKERCYDSGIFTIFYKLFLTRFSQQYGLDQVVDSKTSDVTRACFISYDPNIYFNENAESIDINTIINTENTYDMFLAKKGVEEINRSSTKIVVAEIKKDDDVDNDVIQNIKSILQNSPKPVVKPPAYVPEQLNDVMFDLESYLINAGIVIKEIKNISYGKKIKVFIGTKEAEVNMFYGKRGFSVVQSPRTGTTSELNQMLADLINAFLATN